MINTISKELIKSILFYLKSIKKVKYIQFTEPHAFSYYLDVFKRIQAGGGCVLNTNGDVLLMKRKGVWDLPKGKLNKGEAIPTAAVREVEEECNVFSIDLQEKLCVTYHMYFDKKWLLKETHWYKMKSMDWTNCAPQIEEDIEEIEWVDPNSLDIAMLDTYMNIKVVLNRLQRNLANT